MPSRQTSQLSPVQFSRFLNLQFCSLLDPTMDEFNMRRSKVPAFGSWDCEQNLGFTQCFESARQPGIFRYSYPEDRDLYVTGDLYENDVVTPAVIVVPRRREKVGCSKEKVAGKDGWKVCSCECELKTPPYPAAACSTPPYRRPPKAVDEDLYRISPELLRTSSKRKKAWSFFISCLQPTCLC